MLRPKAFFVSVAFRFCYSYLGLVLSGVFNCSRETQDPNVVSEVRSVDYEGSKHIVNELEGLCLRRIAAV